MTVYCTFTYVYMQIYFCKTTDLRLQASHESVLFVSWLIQISLVTSTEAVMVIMPCCLVNSHWNGMSVRIKFPNFIRKKELYLYKNYIIFKSCVILQELFYHFRSCVIFTRIVLPFQELCYLYKLYYLYKREHTCFRWK